MQVRNEGRARAAAESNPRAAIRCPRTASFFVLSHRSGRQPPCRSPTMKTRTLAAALLVALAAVPCVHAKSGASGTVTADGATWKVADAVAVSDDGDVEIWFSKLEFDR